MNVEFTDQLNEVDANAWSAAFSGQVGKLDLALAQGADPNSKHPIMGYQLLAQAVKSSTKACEMSAVLIDRGAKLPDIHDPLAFELTWRAIVEDNVLLAKKLTDDEPKWSAYFLAEKAKYVTMTPTKLDALISAKAAIDAIDRFNRDYAPHKQERSFGSIYKAR